MRERVTSEWTFLTNHAHVLVCIDRDPTQRTRDIAAAVGITERATQALIADLVTAGYVTRTREGRRNVYTVRTESPLRHPLEWHRTVGDLLALLDPSRSTGTATKGAATSHRS